MKDDEDYQERLQELLPMIRTIQAAIDIVGREKAREIAAAAFGKYAYDRFVRPYDTTPPAERWVEFRESIINGADEATYELEDYNENKVAILYHQCTFLDIFRDFGLADFVPLYCKTDFTTCKQIHPGIELSRTQTLAEGAPYCNHCWRFKAK